MKEQIRKRDILNLVKYYAEKNDAGFRQEAYSIARYFDSTGDSQLAEYIMAMLSGTNTFVPQDNIYNLPFFTKVSLATGSFRVPQRIEQDLIGVINSISRNMGVNKFLFEGDPGTGKTESVKQIARILERDLYMVDFEQVIDSKLGQTSKNIASIFKELENLPSPERVVILFDELDAIALDRVNGNDLREMGRVTTTVLKGLDGLSDAIVLIATTNLYGKLDKALTRRFDTTINFNRYTQEDLIDVSESILNDLLARFKLNGRNMKLFKKIIGSMKNIPYPGELTNLIKTSIAFSDASDELDYLRKLYSAIHIERSTNELELLKQQGFTVREIEVLTGISKSQVSRELQD